MRPPAQDRHGETTPDLVITGGKVLCLSRSRAALLDADVAVSGGMITEVGDARSRPCVPGKGAETIDARGCLVMPGLVNAHSHAAMTLFRGFADDLPLREWLHDRIFPAEARFLEPDTVYWGALLGCLEMIASGTTCIADGYFFQDQTVRAVLKAGLRGLVAQGVIDFPAPGVPEPKENLAVAKRFVERWHGVSDRVIPGIFCHSPVTCGGLTLRGAWRICRDFGVPLQIHLSETLAEAGDVTARTGKRPVHYLDELGIVGPGLIAAHAVHLDDGEMAYLKEKGAAVVHVPESNMKLCSGAARVREMLDMGLTVGLGTDGCASNNNLDLFQEMDTAAKLGKVRSMDPVSIDAETVLRMTVTGGAAVLGMEKEIGAIEAGRRADIIILDLHRPHLHPMYEPASTLVYSADGGDVRDVIVDGRILMRNRAFTSLDPAEIKARVKAAARRIMR